LSENKYSEQYIIEILIINQST